MILMIGLNKMDKLLNMLEIGSIVTSRLSGSAKVLANLTKYRYILEFNDGTQVIASKGNIVSGSFSNPNLVTTYNKGYSGIGTYKSKGEISHYFWYKMMHRAYCLEYKQKHPTYKDITVCDSWHCYQEFAHWVTKRKQYGRLGFNLDKDLIQNGNTVYCPENCSLVPQAINKLTVTKSKERGIPTGVVDYGGYFVAKCRTEDQNVYLGTFSCPEKAGDVYRKFKKKVIIDTANKYKDDLDVQVYESLINFDVKR